MKITACNSKHTLEWDIPEDLSGYFPSLKKIIRNKNLTDVAEKINGIYSLVGQLHVDNKVCEDLYGGVGFSAALLEQLGFDMVLNDIEKPLAKFLKKRYDKVVCKDINKLEMDPVPYRFLDSSNFTFNHLYPAFYQSLLRTKECVLYTDVFPFSMKPFNKERLYEYFQRCNDWLSLSPWCIHSYYLYKKKNVMIVRLTKNKRVKIRRVDTADRFTFNLSYGLFG